MKIDESEKGPKNDINGTRYIFPEVKKIGARYTF
jgi:hypothetical protein